MVADGTRVQRTGASALVDALRELDADVVFGLPGVHNLAVWEAVAGTGIRLVGVRHEQAAVYAADGYARATGRLGVAVVTTGPGAANTLGATGEAMASGSPVLVVATDIPTTLRRAGVYRGVLHETRDQAAMFVPVTKAATTVSSAGEVYADVVAAASTALRASSGPVYLGVPTDLLNAPVGDPVVDPVGNPGDETAETAAPGTAGTARPAGRTELADAELAEALRLVEAAERPLLWAGAGALRANAGEVLGRLAERLAAPVVTTYGARGLLPPGHPCLVPGPVHVQAVGRLWDEADLVVAVGSDFDGMMTQNWSMPAPRMLLTVNVDREDASKNYRADHTLVGDARHVLTEVLDRVRPRSGLEQLRSDLEVVGARVRALVREEEPLAAQLLDVLDRCAPSDAVITADMCIAGYWIAAFHRVPGPRQLSYPMGWGTLGHAFPAALGAAMSGSSRTIAVVGDGGFLFACGELATMVQEDLPLTVVIVDDAGYGMLRYDQMHAHVPTRGVDLATPDFTVLAHAFGVEATAVDGFGAAFEATLTDYVRSPKPNVIVVRAAMTPPPSTSPRWYRKRTEQQ